MKEIAKLKEAVLGSTLGFTAGCLLVCYTLEAEKLQVTYDGFLDRALSDA